MQKLLVVGLTIFVASCAKNTQSPNNVCGPIMCNPIYGRDQDWDIISDDLARNIYRHNKLCEKYNQGKVWLGD